jgi:hypothetical protein
MKSSLLHLFLEKFKNHEYDIWRKIHFMIKTFREVWNDFEMKIYDLQNCERIFIKTMPAPPEKYKFLYERERGCDSEPEVYLLKKIDDHWRIINDFYPDIWIICESDSKLPPSKGWDTHWESIQVLRVILKEIANGDGYL